MVEPKITQRDSTLELEAENYWTALEAGNWYLYELRDFPQARTHLLRAIQLNAHEWRTYHSLCDLYLNEGDAQSAEMAERQALVLKMFADPSQEAFPGS